MAPVRSIPLRSTGLRTVPLGTQSVSFRNGVPVSARASANPLLNGGVGAGQGTNPLSVVNAVLSWANEPASAVAYALRGDPANVGRSLLNFSVPVTKFVDRLESPDAHVSDTPVVRRAINRLPAPFRFPVAFGVDLFTDPTTYLTFGTSGVAKQLGKEGAEAVAQKAAASATEAGIRAAERKTAELAAKRAAGRGIRVNLALPFTRNRTVPLFTVPTGGAERAAAAVTRKVGRGASRISPATAERVAEIPEALRSSLLPTRGANPVTNAAAQAARRWLNQWEKKYVDAADALETEIVKRSRQLKVKPTQLWRDITFHIDHPARFAEPAGASDLVVKARQLLDEIKAADFSDGIVFDEVDSYAPHILKNRREMRKWEAQFGPRSDAMKAAMAGTPGYVHSRTMPHLTNLEAAGFKVEDNIAELIRQRAKASARARLGRAIENVVVRNADGIRPPGKALPDLDKVAAGDSGREAVGARSSVAGSGGSRGTATDVIDHAERVISENNAVLERPGRFASADEIARRMEEGWQEITHSASYLNGVRLPPDAARELARVHKWIADSMKDPNAALRFMQDVMGLWKRFALATPGFHVRNMMGDALRSWWAGARSPVSYVQAWRLLRAARAGRPLTVRIRGKVYSADEIVNLARDNGALDIGYVSSEVRNAGSRRSVFFNYGAGRHLNPLRVSENVGDARENWARMSLFLERLKAGDAPAEAARVTRTWLFDYGEVGAFLDVARRYWTPFIVYTAKSTPLVARAFLERPARASHIYSLMNVAQQEAGNPDLSQVPEDMRQAIPMPPWMSAVVGRVLNAQPTATGERPTLLVNPRGILDYPNLGLADPRLARRNLSDLLGPQIKAPIEQLTGYSFYRGGMFPDRVRAGATAELLGRIPGAQSTGLFGTKRDSYTGDQVPAINSRLDALLRLAPPYSQIGSLLSPLVPGQSDTPNLGAARTLAGLPVTPYDRAKQAYYISKYGR